MGEAEGGVVGFWNPGQGLIRAGLWVASLRKSRYLERTPLVPLKPPIVSLFGHHEITVQLWPRIRECPKGGFDLYEDCTVFKQAARPVFAKVHRIHFLLCPTENLHVATK